MKIVCYLPKLLEIHCSISDLCCEHSLSWFLVALTSSIPCDTTGTKCHEWYLYIVGRLHSVSSKKLWGDKTKAHQALKHNKVPGMMPKIQRIKLIQKCLVQPAFSMTARGDKPIRHTHVNKQRLKCFHFKITYHACMIPKKTWVGGCHWRWQARVLWSGVTFLLRFPKCVRVVCVACVESARTRLCMRA